MSKYKARMNLLPHLAFALLFAHAIGQRPPNIIFIIADDLGFNDVPWNSFPPQIPMPNLHSLAQSGIIFNQMRVQPVCTPSRSEIFTGRHAIHTGVYDAFRGILSGNQKLPLEFKLLPEILKEAANYSTHLVGKWHLGSNAINATPTARGFDTHYGYLTGKQSQFNHSIGGGYDFYDNFRIAVEANNSWSTDLITTRSIKIIQTHASTIKSQPQHQNQNPLFLVVAYQNVHGPLEVPDKYMEMFQNTTGNNSTRQALCALATFMDDSIGQIIKSLQDSDLFTNSLIIFTSDNGGPSNMQGSNWASNYPLRGGKGSLLEGGIRVPAFITGVGIDPRKAGTVSDMYMSGVDWTPTLIRAATNRSWTDFIDSNSTSSGGGNGSDNASDAVDIQFGDGIDQWEAISTTNVNTTKRDFFLLQTNRIGHTNGILGHGLIKNNWKLVNLHHAFPQLVGNYSWLPPPGQNPDETQYSTPCSKPPSVSVPVDPKECMFKWCLFDLSNDPCEHSNVASKHPDIVHSLHLLLLEYAKTSRPAVGGEGCMPVKIPLYSSSSDSSSTVDKHTLVNENDESHQKSADTVVTSTTAATGTTITVTDITGFGTVSAFAWAPCDLPLPAVDYNNNNTMSIVVD